MISLAIVPNTHPIEPGSESKANRTETWASPQLGVYKTTYAQNGRYPKNGKSFKYPKNKNLLNTSKYKNKQTKYIQSLDLACVQP